MRDTYSFFIKGFKHSAFFTAISRITGFVRDVFLASFLGAGINSDIFFIAFKLPNLFRRITAEGALTSAFLPIFTLIKEKERPEILNYFVKIFFIKVIFYLSFILVLLEIFMPILVYVLAPGFLKNELLINQVVTLSRITIIFMPLISLVALLGAICNASGRFWAIGITPIILNLFLILSCFYISDLNFLKSLPLAVGVVVAGFCQLIFMVIIVIRFNILNIRKNNKIILTINEKNNINFYIKKIWKKFIPAGIGGGIQQINLLVDTILASFLGVGSVSYLYYADRVAQLPIGIIGIALSTSLITSLSQAVVLKKMDQFSYQLETSFKIGLFFSIPSSLVFIFFPELIVSSLFERGEFGIVDTTGTVLALIAYASGIPAFILLKSCQPAFLAEGNTKTPMKIAMILLFFNIFGSIILMKFLAHAGIALATSLSSWLGCIIYLKILLRDKKIKKGVFFSKNKLYGLYSIIKYGIIISLISIVMILVMKICYFYLNSFLFFKINIISSLIILIFVGLFIYFLTCRILGYIPKNLYLKKSK